MGFGNRKQDLYPGWRRNCRVSCDKYKPNLYRYGRTHAYTNLEPNAYGDSNCHGYVHSDADAHGNFNSYCDTYDFTDSDPNTYYNTKVYTDSPASPRPGTALCLAIGLASNGLSQTILNRATCPEKSTGSSPPRSD